MATVTMDINELDKLRQELKEQKDKQETLTKELNDVKSDKRVIVRKKSPEKSDFTFSFDHSRYAHDRKYGRITDDGGRWVSTYIELYPIKHFGQAEAEFINFEDAKVELRKQLESEFGAELADLKHIRVTLTERVKAKELECIEVQKKLIKEHTEIEESLNEAINLWKKQYKDLEEGKKELTEIERLKARLEEMENAYITERDKPWWKKIF